MTEVAAQKKLTGFMLILIEVWERFDGNFFDGQGIDSTLAEMETFIKRFRAEIRERNGNGTT